MRMDVSANNGDQTLLDNTWGCIAYLEEVLLAAVIKILDFTGFLGVFFFRFFVCENVKPFKNLIKRIYL